MFFKYRIYENADTKYALTASTDTGAAALAYQDAVTSLLSAGYSRLGAPIASIEWRIGFTDAVRRRIGSAYVKSDEGYAIVIDSAVRVYAASERACIFAAATLSQLSARGELSGGFLYDVPLSEERGYRVYLPSRAGFEGFCRMVDFLATYKFNAIILEIGGAMEYHRHPEINRAWDEFCRDAHSHSGRSHEIQFKTYPWPKNSIHCDNAEGDILTHEECRAIAAYCRSRGLDVIPECPSLSHCDFLCLAHPELREREADGHPDTYCPLHPDVYTYVFDILEEVIEVFEPRAINIGHDETYSIGICPRCKNTPAYELYANDVKRIYGFLKERGIHTYMWGEKLLNAQVTINKVLHRVGGAGHGEGTRRVPSLWPCRDLLPREGITYLHWYWQFNEDYDKIYHERGMRVLLGNMNALAAKNLTKRMRRGIRGGFVSNWGAFGIEYMQRNQQYLSLLAAAYAFFCEDFEARGKEEMLRICFEEAYRYRLSQVAHPIEITHTVEHAVKFELVWDGIFITDEKYLIGNYELTYRDGTVATLPVRYGSHVGAKYPEKTVGNGEFTQLLGGALPMPHGNGYAWRTLYEDPHPESALVSVRYVPVAGREELPFELIGATRIPRADVAATVNRTQDSSHGFGVAGVQE